MRDGPSEMKDWPVRDECVGGGAGPGCSLRRQALFVCFQGAGRLRRWARYARAVAGVAGGRGGTCIGREEVAKGEAGVARRRCCVGWRKSGAHLIVPLRIREEDAGRAQRRAGRAQRVVMVRLERVKRAQHGCARFDRANCRPRIGASVLSTGCMEARGEGSWGALDSALDSLCSLAALLSLDDRSPAPRFLLVQGRSR